MTFRTADGAQYEGRDASGNERFSISIPLDADGYFGRECPDCHQHFRMQSDDFDALPDDLELICPYCGNRDEHGEFITAQQHDRVMRVAEDAANQLVSDMLDHAFGSMARSTKSNSFLKVSYRSEPFYPEPLPGINEERLIRERTCSSCHVRYAVFGEHRFCPVSGALDPLEVARDSLDAERAKLDAMNEIPEPGRSRLREQGVFDRVSVDTLGRVVGIVEAFASARFHQLVPDADALVKGKGNVFQRLDDFAQLFADHASVQVREAPGVDWPIVQRLWATRHAHVHADGHVDAKYMRTVPSSGLKLGQRIMVAESDACIAIDQAAALCEGLVRTAAE